MLAARRGGLIRRHEQSLQYVQRTTDPPTQPQPQAMSNYEEQMETYSTASESSITMAYDGQQSQQFSRRTLLPAPAMAAQEQSGMLRYQQQPMIAVAQPRPMGPQGSGIVHMPQSANMAHYATHTGPGQNITNPAPQGNVPTQSTCVQPVSAPHTPSVNQQAVSSPQQHSSPMHQSPPDQNVQQLDAPTNWADSDGYVVDPNEYPPLNNAIGNAYIQAPQNAPQTTGSPLYQPGANQA